MPFSSEIVCHGDNNHFPLSPVIRVYRNEGSDIPFANAIGIRHTIHKMPATNPTNFFFKLITPSKLPAYIKTTKMRKCNQLIDKFYTLGHFDNFSFADITR